MNALVLTSVATLSIVMAVGRQPSTQQATGDTLIAIDVLLTPDQTMVARAQAVNARLRGNYPAG